ncbi:diguanylate cyclase (GGDEF)-like protein [Streptomyces canus]|uniref:GGDEF domain-containing protein n=1 Tax=Streptomyces canus TaxID=58343 RepID=UPI0027880034|nr:GGDEF domain-containing protein [Streptomyces canus]MDQ0605516.1 diguanylate cyclase (GGDEF)-like protein [Streptomyces canus]
MPPSSVLRLPPRTFAIAAAAVPLALAVVADDVRVRRQLRTARRDPLTGLSGRDVLMDRITRLAAADREQLHVLVADADGLKAVNDTLGHAAGDVLIAAIGHRIGAWAQARGGLAARLGGDEFAAAVLLSPAATVRDVTALADQLAQPVACGTHRLRPAVSIGTARAADLPDAASASRLLRGADMAMYRVKNGSEVRGYVATRHDAYTPAVHGRRPGRPGTHLPVG